MKSCLYRGRVRHRRFTPRTHGFDYSLYLAYLDLDELPYVFDGRWLWSAGGPNVVSFRREDHLGDPTTGLASSVRDLVEAECGRRPAGPVRLLTGLRTLGYGFNPVSFFYCYGEDGASVETIVADVSNTPWKERHPYVLHAGMDSGSASRNDAAEPGRHRYRFRKAFHVSPFMPMDQDYDWRFTDPGETLAVHMDVARGGQTLFDATLTMERRPLTSGAMAAALASHPFMAGKVTAAIYWNAFLLWLKRVPFHAHPGLAPTAKTKATTAPGDGGNSR